MRTLCALLIAIATLAGFAGPAGAETPYEQICAVERERPLPLQRQAFFTDPGGDNTGAPSDITYETARMIASATSGATVRIAVYFFLDDGNDPDCLVAAIGQATANGANVQMVIDTKYASDARWTGIESAAAADPGWDVRYCQHGCRASSDSNIMHNKFVIVDSLDWEAGNEYGVAQMTANWTDKQLRNHYYNAMLLSWKDQALWTQYNSYFSGLWACASDSKSAARTCGGVNLTTNNSITSTGAWTHFYPRTEADDKVKTQLDAMTCTPGATLDIAMGSWTGSSRGSEILALLQGLAQDGCVVRIVLSHENDIVEQMLSEPDAGSPILVRCTPNGTPGIEGLPGPSMHSKYMLFAGTYDGTANARELAMGSHNFTIPSQESNDEVWARIRWNPASTNPLNLVAWKAFRADFERAWGAAYPCAVARAADAD